MKNRIQAQKWSTVKILDSIKHEILLYCKKENKFANPSQFIHFAIRKELDFRKGKK